MRAYADAAAYTAAGHTAPENVDLLLRLASRITDALLRGRKYPVDADSMPTHEDDVEAMRDATVAIAADMEATGYLTPGGSSQWGSVSIGSVSLSNPITSASGDVSVAGVTIPPAALLSLADVGTVSVVAR